MSGEDKKNSNTNSNTRKGSSENQTSEALTSEDLTIDVAVIGSGPGGYSAAFRAADLGKSVALIEKSSYLGGVCLNVGCIPSKTLLHAAEVIEESQDIASAGIVFQPPKIDTEKLREHKDGIVKKLRQGVEGLSKARKVQVLQGEAAFLDASTLIVSGAEGSRKVHFTDAVIAAGSEPVRLPGLSYDDPRVWTSTEALELSEIPEHLAIIGGGIIGLEMAMVYHALGSRITIIEMLDQIIPQADADVIRPLQKRLKKISEGVYTKTKVTGIDQDKKRLVISLEGKKAPESIEADAVLTAVGRRVSGKALDLDTAGVEVDERGIVQVNAKMQTNVPHIYAVGDITGNPMLAHRASYQGKIASEVIAGLPSAYSVMSVPSIAYTHPEVAWIGMTEKEAKEQDIPFNKGSFPWQASGRALSGGKTNGVTKALFHKETGRLIGAGMTGANAGELLAEAVLALEMGATAEDIAKTMHAHPTLSETFGLTAEIVEGSVTETLNR